MNKFEGEYQGELRTLNTHLASNSQLLTDAPVDNHGKGEAYSPTDLLCTALASCMLTIMGIKASQLEVDLSGMQYKADKIMDNQPRRIQKIKIHFELPATTILNEKDASILKRAALSCPVALSLSEHIEQEVSFNF